MALWVEGSPDAASSHQDKLPCGKTAVLAGKDAKETGMLDYSWRPSPVSSSGSGRGGDNATMQILQNS